MIKLPTFLLLIALSSSFTTNTRVKTAFFCTSKTHQYLLNKDDVQTTSVLERTTSSSSNSNSNSKDVLSKNKNNNIIYKLAQGISLPYEFEYNQSTIRIKHLEKQNIMEAVSLCLLEYGSHDNPSTTITSSSKKKNTKKNSEFKNNYIQSKLDDMCNFILSFALLIGLNQRVEQKEEADLLDPNNNNDIAQDRSVICVYKVNQNQSNQNNEEQLTMIGMVEISLQYPDPSRTSFPFVLPSYIKNIIFWKNTTFTNTTQQQQQQQPYISNVLITKKYRGKGYSKLLMATCEGICKSWGYNTIYLHVDVTKTSNDNDVRPSSNKVAQRLYRNLGYVPVVDETYNKYITWMGSVDIVNRGLYIVDGTPLLFMKKKI